VGKETYDVFVSYSRADWRHAADIDSVLRSKGLKPFFDRRNLAPGLPWVRALEQAIGASKAAIVLIGPRGLGNTQQYERELAFVRQTRDPAFPIVPVILPETTGDPPFDFLRVLTWIDFSHVAKVTDAPDQLELLLTVVQRGQTSANTAREAICPYRGLDAFREEDAAFFFGRGNADDPKSPIGELVHKVREHRFVMVVGRSGSGKSSLVYAGLLPALRRERDRFWNVLSLRPGPAPLRALAAAFNPRTDEGAAEYATKITNEADKLGTGAPDLLAHMIHQELDQAEGKPDRLLLYIDQWEELYAQAQHAADVNRFINLLLTAARSAPVTVVGTVRADFYDPLIAHQELRALLLTRQILLAPMSYSELERTIVEPAKKVGLAFDPPGLVRQILDEAGEDEGMLPLLQYALKESWALRKGNTITGDSYARSGGVREAIRLTAERTFDALSPQEQQVARQLFLRLVTPGEGKEDTRARAAMPVDQAQRKIVEQFASQRTRLLVTGFDRAARPTVEVAHEALIRTWPRLRQWIDSNREKLRSRTAILQAKADWEQHERREDLLLPAGFQLDRARALLAEPGDLTVDDIQEFITLSSAREENERKQKEAEEARVRRQRRKRLLVMGGVTAVLVGAVSLAQSAYKTLYLPWKFDRDLEIVKSDEPPEKRVDALRRLAGYQKTLPKEIDLSAIQLTGEKAKLLDLQGLIARSLQLTEAKLQNVSFQDARLPSSSFIRSTVIGSHFGGADLKFARFDRSFIDSSLFSNSNLFRAVFNAAQLCRVNFSDAIVRYASFWDIAFEDGEPPNFHNSAWWLATGWNKRHRELLTKQSASKDPKETKSFKQELRSVDEMASPGLPAQALNERAWTLATFGVDLAEAERAVREALRMYRANSQSVLSPRDIPNAQDTLAYILMQKGELAEAENLLSEAVRDNSQDDSIVFRYALTLWMQGREQQAQVYLMKSLAQGYSPSHELYVLRGRIPDALESALEAASGIRERSFLAKPPPCPPP
jgi:energy-coupling factor transporter ATP-binding protein EcfA2